MGYTRVFVYNEGLPEWIKRGYPADLKKIYPAVEVPHITAAQLKDMIDRKERVFILDIRDEDDARAGTIRGAKNIDLENLDSRLSEIPKNRNIVVMDLHGKQTNMAARFLAWKGFRNISRLDGGFVSGWVMAGFPVEK